MFDIFLSTMSNTNWFQRSLFKYDSLRISLFHVFAVWIIINKYVEESDACVLCPDQQSATLWEHDLILNVSNIILRSLWFMMFIIYIMVHLQSHRS